MPRIFQAMESEQKPKTSPGRREGARNSAMRPSARRDKGDGTMVSLEDGSVFGDGDVPLPKRWVGALIVAGVVIAGLTLWGVIALI